MEQIEQSSSMEGDALSGQSEGQEGEQQPEAVNGRQAGRARKRGRPANHADLEAGAEAEEGMQGATDLPPGVASCRPV